MIMDYRALAEQLLDLQALLRLDPVNQQVSIFEKGTFLALQYLSHQKTVHPKELSQQMAVSSARIAALLNHMENEGLIVRSPDPNDNRQVTVSLTARGEQLIKKKKEEVVNIMAKALEELGPEEAEIYLRIQTKFLTNFKKKNSNKGYNYILCNEGGL